MKKKISNLISNQSEGLYCQSADIWIDPIKPVKRAIITHSHFDHIAIGCREYICSVETGTILKHRIGDKINIKTYDYNESFKLDGVNISLHPSGHILGSSQVMFESGGEVWLITGDFKRQEDKTCLEYKTIETDVLICESTFSLPIFRWESTGKIINQISNWVYESQESTCILFCYSLGKAQRLLSEINQIKSNNIYVHKSINKINKIYRKLGVDILETNILDKDSNINNSENNLILLPPSLNKSIFLRKFKNFETGFASGWMSIRALRKRSGYDKGFAISDHADWDGLIKTIKDSKASRILLNHGDGSNLAKYLKTVEHINIESLS